MKFCVGLTGGIGCGKTAATDAFAALGAGVVDTDVISRELTAAGGAAMPKIVAEFGPEFSLADGGLDRARMRTLVFSDASAKKRLEAILHPLIRDESRKRIAEATAPYVLLVVPLLLETGSYADLLDRILVVDCEEETQIARVMTRSGLTAEEVRNIMNAQIARAGRLARADDVLVNDADINHLRGEVARLHDKYLAEARARP